MIIFFDVDDTLIDHRAAERRAAGRFLEHYAGVLPYDPAGFPEHWHALSEKYYAEHLAGRVSFQGQRRLRIRHLFSVIGRTMTDEEADRHFSVYLACYESSWRLFPDVLPALDALRARPLGVITNGILAQQTKKLAEAGIASRFRWLWSGEELGCTKPNTAIFHHACRAAQTVPEQCVYVGDSLELDALASRAAGWRAVWLNRGAACTPPPGIEMIADLGALPGLLS